MGKFCARQEKEMEGNPLSLVKSTDLPTLTVSPAQFAQVVHSYLKNLHRGTAHSKTRGEVRGGGRKPWRQKGTGRARAGSIRSPLWRGGGITFGPRREHSLAVRFNSKERRKAFSFLLRAKVEEGALWQLESETKATKTKEALALLAPVLPAKLLLVVGTDDETLVRAARNLSGVTVKSVASLNLLDLLKAERLVVTATAWSKLKEKLHVQR